jgi:hypothetical protein
MRFRDLRETKKEIPVYETVVSVRADIALERSFCLNEVEAKEFVRSRINEVSPNLKVKDITVTHKDRRDDVSLWEAGVSLAGRVAITDPIPKPAIKTMVQELVKRAGLENADVKVHGTIQKDTTDVATEPDERDFRDMAEKALRDRFPQKERLSTEQFDKMKLGSHVVVTQAGFTEEGFVKAILRNEGMVEVTVGPFSKWLPFSKIVEVLPFRPSPSDAQTESGGLEFSLTTSAQDHVDDGELEQGTNLFKSTMEFRSKSMSESQLEDKTWKTAKEFEADFPGALKVLEDMAKESAVTIGEKEVGTVCRHSGIGDSLGAEEATVIANFEESEFDFSEAYSKDNKIRVLLSVKTPADIGEFRIQG